MIQGNIVSKPISIKEVRNLLNSDARSQDIITSYNLGRVCLHGNINKWAKYKPINYPKITELTTGEFRGSAEDIGNGIIYGIKNAPTALRWNDIPTVSFDYAARPRGGEQSPFRLSDFNGYYHGASINIKTDVPAEVFNTNPNGIEVYIDYTPKMNRLPADQNYSLSMEDFLTGSSAKTFEQYYPCIMIDNYVHALRNSQYGDATHVTPLSYGGSLYKAFHIEVPDFIRYSQEHSEHTVSVFMASAVHREQYGFDIETKWMVLDTEQVSVSNVDLLSIPEVAGLQVLFFVGIIFKHAISKSGTTYTVDMWGSENLNVEAMSGHTVGVEYNGTRVDLPIKQKIVSVKEDTGAFDNFDNPILADIQQVHPIVNIEPWYFGLDSLDEKLLMFHVGITGYPGREYRESVLMTTRS